VWCLFSDKEVGKTGWFKMRKRGYGNGMRESCSTLPKKKSNRGEGGWWSIRIKKKGGKGGNPPLPVGVVGVVVVREKRE